MTMNYILMLVAVLITDDGEIPLMAHHVLFETKAQCEMAKNHHTLYLMDDKAVGAIGTRKLCVEYEGDGSI